MTPETTLAIKMPAIFYMFLQRHGLVDRVVHQDNVGVLMVEDCITIAKHMLTGDLDGVDSVKLEIYNLLIRNNVSCGVDEVNEIIAVMSETIMIHLVSHDLVDYIQYVMDMRINKLLLRVYKLDTSIDTSQGVTEIF